MPFSDPIVDGTGALVREAIKSPNFVPGVDGWQIAKDGTAEFLDLLARGDLSGSTLTIPEGATTTARIVIDTTGIKAYNDLNQLVFEIVPDVAFPGAVTPEPGIIIGESSQIQLAFYARQAPTAGGIMQWLMNNAAWKNASLDAFLTGAGGAQIGQMYLSPPAPSAAVAGLGNMQLQFLSQSANLINNHASFTVQSNDTSRIGPVATFKPTSLEVASGVDLKVGNGPAGGSLSGNWTWSESRASNTLASISAVAQTQLNSDYGSPFAGGIFTPPVDAYYDIFFFMGAASSATREACIIRKNGAEIAHNEAPNATNLATFVISEYLLTTDTIDFRPFYVSATTPQTLSGRINIARRV